MRKHIFNCQNSSMHDPKNKVKRKKGNRSSQNVKSYVGQDHLCCCSVKQISTLVALITQLYISSSIKTTSWVQQPHRLKLGHTHCFCYWTLQQLVNYNTSHDIMTFVIITINRSQMPDITTTVNTTHNKIFFKKLFNFHSSNKIINPLKQ